MFCCTQIMWTSLDNKAAASHTNRVNLALGFWLSSGMPGGFQQMLQCFPSFSLTITLADNLHHVSLETGKEITIWYTLHNEQFLCWGFTFKVFSGTKQTGNSSVTISHRAGKPSLKSFGYRGAFLNGARSNVWFRLIFHDSTWQLQKGVSTLGFSN